MTLREQFTGTGVAIVTPFTADGEIDWTSFRNLINYQLNNGVRYLVVLGTTGESATIHGDEKQRVFSFVNEVAAGRCPLMAGIGNYDTRAVLDSLKQFDLTGYSAILTVSPYYNKPSQEGLYQHFRAVNDNSPLPVVMYNVPGRTGQNMTAETQLRIAIDCKNIFATKEASGNLEQITQIVKSKPAHFMVISGDDGLALPSIACGAEGLISVAANAYPAAYSEMIRLALENKFHEARQIHLKHADIASALFADGSPGGIKAVLNIMGHCAETFRLPVVAVNGMHRAKIKSLMRAIDPTIE